MVPLACVELPAFPLQLLLRHRPEWAHYPTAVVAEDKPQGLILWVNERARQHGVLLVGDDTEQGSADALREQRMSGDDRNDRHHDDRTAGPRQLLCDEGWPVGSHGWPL